MEGPAYLIDLDRLAENCRTAHENAAALGVELLMALKAFPLPAAFETIAPYVGAFTASGLYEARLGAAGGVPVHVHAPAYAPGEIEAMPPECTHIVFNSIAQLRRYAPVARARGMSVGLRINPGFSRAGSLKYDPCCPDSRFGVLIEEYDRAYAQGGLPPVDGVHIHALCEGYASDFAALVERFDRDFGSRLGRFKWVNLGGGEVIDRPGYATAAAVAAVRKLRSHGDFAVWIEPSEYLVRSAGRLRAHVLDVIHREKDIAVLDVSLSCHATDLLLFDMRAEVLAPEQAEDGRETVLGCVSCLAGDVLGTYRFRRPLSPGDTVEIGSMGCYSFAQASWFNGVRRPEVRLVSRSGGERTVLTWDYDDYRREFGGVLL